MAQKEMFSVIEYGAGFAIRHNPSGEEIWLSDGVDCIFDEAGDAYPPGTVGFTDLWAESFNADTGETLEAYFPQHVDD